MPLPDYMLQWFQDSVFQSTQFYLIELSSITCYYLFNLFVYLLNTCFFY